MHVRMRFIPMSMDIAPVFCCMKMGRHRTWICGYMRAADMRLMQMPNPVAKCLFSIGILFGVRKDRRTFSCRPGVLEHLFNIHIHMLSKVYLIDDKQIRTADARSALARHVATARHINHENLRID